jgi:hypothetical protein
MQSLIGSQKVLENICNILKLIPPLCPMMHDYAQGIIKLQELVFYLILHGGISG